MDKFTYLEGVCVVLMRDNIDTDAIIPSREMKSVSKQGLSDGLFAAWRYLDEAARTPNPEFPLNLKDAKGASILLAGSNFGCGSSREHAVWALKEYGFRCIIAASFGAIFYRNCIANGVLPIELNKNDLNQLRDERTLAVDLTKQTIDTNIKTLHFEIDQNKKRSLLLGLDPIALTQQQQSTIDKFRSKDKQRRPWIYGPPSST